MTRREKPVIRVRKVPHRPFLGVAVRHFKDRISEYLQVVQAGEIVVVTSHGRPVADLVPHREKTLSLEIRKATRRWGSVKFPRTGKGRTDSLSLLFEDRRKR
jgi:prevent-host-death family protein